MNAKEKERKREERKRKRIWAHTDDRPVTKHVLSLWGEIPPLNTSFVSELIRYS